MGVAEAVRDVLFPDVTYLFGGIPVGQVNAADSPKKDAFGMEVDQFKEVGVYDRVQQAQSRRLEVDKMGMLRRDMVMSVEQYRVFKDIMERNSQLLGLSEESLRSNCGRAFDDLPTKWQQAFVINQYRAIDCRIMHSILLDLKRQKMMAKCNDDGFIFLMNQKNTIGQSGVRSQVVAQAMLDGQSPTKVGARRFEISDSKKSRNAVGEVEAAKSLAGAPGDPANQVESLQVHNALPGQLEGEEITRRAEKRSRNLFKKLYNVQTTRLLSVLGYTPVEADERKYIHSNFKREIMAIAGEHGEGEYMTGTASDRSVPSGHEPGIRRLPRQIRHALAESSTKKAAPREGSPLPQLVRKLSLNRGDKNDLQAMQDEIGALLEQVKPQLLQQPSSRLNYHNKYEELIAGIMAKARQSNNIFIQQSN